MINYQTKKFIRFISFVTAFEISLPTITMQILMLALSGCYSSETSSSNLNGTAGEILSEEMMLEVDAAYAGLRITQQPQNISLNVGSTINLSVQATTDRPPLSYQWKKLISGTYQNYGSVSSSNILSVTNAQLSHAGSYKVVVMNANRKKLTSSAAQVSVNAVTAVEENLSVSPQIVNFSKSNTLISPSQVAMVITAAAGASWRLADQSPHIDVTPTSGIVPSSGNLTVYARPSLGATQATSNSSTIGTITVGTKTVNYTLNFNVVSLPPPPPPSNICGDGNLGGSEACDDGNLINNDGCSSVCQFEVITPTAQCGNQRIETGESCDDGNLVNGDGCSSSCSIEVVSGDAPILIPGNGWGTLDTVALSGISGTNGAAATREPIAHWEAVHYQTVTGSQNLNIGILAYHYHGIKKVSFSVDNGPWADVFSATENPQTASVVAGVGMPAVKEYWVKLDASKFSRDTLAEVRAIIYPNIGKPLVLKGSIFRNRGGDPAGPHYATAPKSSLFINIDSPNDTNSLAPIVRYVSKTNAADSANCGLTQSSPCATIGQALASTQIPRGANVELRLSEGNWSVPNFGNTYYDSLSTRWSTITAAPGANPDNVVLSSFAGSGDLGGFGFRFLRFYRVTVTGRVMGNYSDNYLWFDHMTLKGAGSDPYHWDDSHSPYFDAVYLTDVYFPASKGGSLRGKSNTLSRNIYAALTLGGHTSDSATVVNYVVKDIVGGGKDAQGIYYDVHGDLYQCNYSRTSDIIMYNFHTLPGVLRSTRGIACFDVQDVAIDNFDLDMPDSSNQMFGISGNSTHIIIQNSYFGRGGGSWGMPGTMGNPQLALLNNSYFATADATYHVPNSVSLPGVSYAPLLQGSQYSLLLKGDNGKIEKSSDQESFAAGSQVTLRAIPNPGYQFSGWSGDVSGTANPVTITMSGTAKVKYVRAIYSRIAN